MALRGMAWSDPDFAIPFATLVTHYWSHDGFALRWSRRGMPPTHDWCNESVTASPDLLRYSELPHGSGRLIAESYRAPHSKLCLTRSR